MARLNIAGLQTHPSDDIYSNLAKDSSIRCGVYTLPRSENIQFFSIDTVVKEIAAAKGYRGTLIVRLVGDEVIYRYQTGTDDMIKRYVFVKDSVNLMRRLLIGPDELIPRKLTNQCAVYKNGDWRQGDRNCQSWAARYEIDPKRANSFVLDDQPSLERALNRQMGLIAFSQTRFQNLESGVRMSLVNTGAVYACFVDSKAGRATIDLLDSISLKGPLL